MTKADTLRRAMARKKWKASDLSRESGVDDTLIRKYLLGRVGVGLKNAPKLARALGITPAKLTFG